MWRNLFHLQFVPWVQDHKVGGDVVFHFAGSIALAGEAINQLTGCSDGSRVRNMTVSLAIIVPEGNLTDMITTLRPVCLMRSLNISSWAFTFLSYNSQSWNKHSTGEVIAVASAPGPNSNPSTSLPRKISASGGYDTMSTTGLNLGPAFHTMESMESLNSRNLQPKQFLWCMPMSTIWRKQLTPSFVS